MPNLQPAVSSVNVPRLGTDSKAAPVQPQAQAPAAVQTPAAAPVAGDKVEVSTQGSATPTLSLGQEPEPQFITHTVRRGETLAEISKKYLGSPNRHLEIFNANRDELRNPNDLSIGMTLKIPVPAQPVQPAQPAKPEQPAVDPVGPVAPVAPVEPAQPASFTSYTVQRGDSLSSIALDTLGDSERYMELYQANRDVLKDPDALRKGMVLKIPAQNGAAQPAQPNKPGTPSPTAPTAPVTGPVDASGLTPGAQELLTAMKRYQQHHAQLGNAGRTKTTEAQMIAIARELDSASKAFGVDPKMMLALYAHESGGINPGARSHTGAGGLGQLTSIAIRQVHFMAGIGKGNRGQAPYTEHKGNFVQNSRSINQRYDIKANVWTSVAYMSYELNDRARLGRGVEKALKRYGDPNVSTYANKVNAEYNTLFGGKLF